MRAALFNFEVPRDLAGFWFWNRLPALQPAATKQDVAPTREFCIELFKTKLETVLRQDGDAFGEASNLSPAAALAKDLILEVIPRILPQGTGADAKEYEHKLYRFVLEHGDFGIHNMDIFEGRTERPLVTGLHGWNNAHLMPAILADLNVCVQVTLTVDEDVGMPAMTDMPSTLTTEEMIHMAPWPKQYFEVSEEAPAKDPPVRMDPDAWARNPSADWYTQPLFKMAPDYGCIIDDGRRARYLWSALHYFDDDDPEGSWKDLGEWASEQIADMDEHEHSSDEEMEENESEPEQGVKNKT
jgi:hypothetical protein